MTKRERLEAKRKLNLDKIEDLKKQNIELAKELCLLSEKEVKKLNGSKHEENNNLWNAGYSCRHRLDWISDELAK